jgi:hypothetical protein
MFIKDNDKTLKLHNSILNKIPDIELFTGNLIHSF